ncbi:acyl-CoA thioesterase [Patulibacter defluvii]|uniref:acyl-CoA thioesterase n=1 Tax=Patulibacter defluvii TaxID=3095358 RepID=UPI002A761C53|nr:thioesterase family protein [Patulibacter sp. DM4]
MSAPSVPTTAFDRATTVRLREDGVVEASVDSAWSAPTGPNGGYLAAIVVRALRAVVDPAGELRLRSLTLHYLRGAADGPLELTVELLRRGRRVSSARVRARQGDRAVLEGLAAFSAAELPSPVDWTPRLPDVAPPPALDAEGLPVPEYRPRKGRWIEPLPQMPPVVHQVRLAPQLGGIPLAGRVPEPGGAVETGGWIALPEPRPIDEPFVALAADIWWPPVFEAVSRPVIAPTVDLTIHFRAGLPPEGLPPQPIFGHYRSTAASEGFVEEDGLLFLPDGSLLAQSRQLALLAPVG